MKNMNQTEKCRSCYIQLPESNQAIGVCDTCAEKECRELKKRMKKSCVLGILLLLFQICLRSYVRRHYVDVDGLTVAIQTLMGPVRLSSRAFYEMFFPSQYGEILFLAFCFFLPFSQLTYISLSPVKDRAIRKLQSQDALVAHRINRTSAYNYDDLGIFVLAVLLAVVAGPFWFVYRVLRIRRLERHLAVCSSEKR